MFTELNFDSVPCRHASVHEKMFLKAILAEFRRSGVEEANFKGVHQQLDAIYKTEGVYMYRTVAKFNAHTTRQRDFRAKTLPLKYSRLCTCARGTVS